MEIYPFKLSAKAAHTKKTETKIRHVVILTIGMIMFLVLSLGHLWLAWDKINPIPKAVTAEGKVIQKYYQSTRKRIIPDRPIIIYSYENPYWADKPQKPVKTRGGMVTAKVGIAARQEVGRSFYKKTEIGDKIIIRYRPSSDIKQNTIKGGLPLGRLIFNLCAALFSLTLTAFCILAVFDVSRVNREQMAL